MMENLRKKLGFRKKKQSCIFSKKKNLNFQVQIDTLQQMYQTLHLKRQNLFLDSNRKKKMLVVLDVFVFLFLTSKSIDF
jgi:hypothetical protein